MGLQFHKSYENEVTNTFLGFWGEEFFCVQEFEKNG